MTRMRSSLFFFDVTQIAVGTPGPQQRARRDIWCTFVGLCLRSFLIMEQSLQSNTANSTPVAEFVGLPHSTLRGLIPQVALAETLVERDAPAATVSDSATAITGAETWFSRRLAYLKKYQRVSIGVVHVWNARPENVSYKIEG